MKSNELEVAKVYYMDQASFHLEKSKYTTLKEYSISFTKNAFEQLLQKN